MVNELYGGLKLGVGVSLLGHESVLTRKILNESGLSQNLRHVRNHSFWCGLEQNINHQRVDVLSRCGLVSVIDQMVTADDYLAALHDTVEFLSRSLDLIHHPQLSPGQLPHFVVS